MQQKLTTPRTSSASRAVAASQAAAGVAVAPRSGHASARDSHVGRANSPVQEGSEPTVKYTRKSSERAEKHHFLVKHSYRHRHP